ncbi:MAG: 4-alpha-glucanotransferase [Oscillospiraceae bacterium]|nr:4-alpha-glucanotransferase [Oscillospiraceae bacterium]
MRASGILMHITSLPGPYGVGTLGKESYKFVDFLEKAGQTYWQVLPLTPTGYGDSPYQSCSTFAGNHYLIDLDLLVEEGLLEEDEITACNWGDDESRVDFGLLYTHKLSVLRKAYARFARNDDLEKFYRENAYWLSDYALYMALKEAYGGKPWYAWPEGVRFREPEAIWQVRKEWKEEVQFHCFVQYLFSTQWENLREYAHKKGVSIIGDVPIYVPYDSVDVWSNPQMFCLDETLTPTAVAGCPPDAFSEDGQLWGNPLYRWETHKADGYGWWLQRLQAAANRYDVIRIDHFRGFAGYYAIPYGAENAKGGKWLPGPGMDFIRAVQTCLPNTPMIAEDLGYLTEDVHRLRQDAGYPGMKVLEFAFDGDASNLYLPHNHEKNTVCYIGTHDNMPVKQWFAESSEQTINFVKNYMGQPADPQWGVIRMCLSSIADLAMVQMQDYLELGGEARMNFPGTQTGHNWTWRAAPDFASDALAKKIYSLTRIYGRLQQ